MADDDDPGSTFLKGHMTEAGLSDEAGSLRHKPSYTPTKGTDDYYEQKYGKPIDLGASGEDVMVTRRQKGDKAPGSTRGSKTRGLSYD